MAIIKRSSSLLLLVCTSFLLLACASKVAKEENYSGFLSDYSQLSKVELANGTQVMRWISPALQNKKYSKIYIDPVVVYPAPKNTAQVDARLVNDSAAYLEQALRQQLNGVIEVVDDPSEMNSIRMRAAITSVQTPTEGLKAYEVIPIALLIAGATTAAGSRDHTVDVYLEAELTDANTNEVLARVVKKGISEETLENKETKATMANIKPTLDAWAKDGLNFVKTSLVK
jgi:hypothetical protein